MTVHHLVALDLVTGEKPAKPPKRRMRRPTITSEVAQATKAGIPVKSASKAPDGTVTLTFGQPDAPTKNDVNEWDTELEHGRH
jgi:hypothetical protein